VRTDLSEIIAENFGANATYVEGLLSRFRSNPELVDESWRNYFAELLSDGNLGQAEGASASPVEPTLDRQARENGGRGLPANAGPAEAAAPAKSAAQPKAAAKQAPTAPAAATDQATDQVEAIPIRGVALKIVENMESSLSVPTATSQRRIPVKLLDENRRIINKYLQENDRGKASYTHLIAWALLRALDEFPQLNDGFDVVDGNPVRLHRQSINLGVAIDVTKKDGTRTLLVPNIKGANKLRFSQFLTAYDDVVRRAREGKLQLPDFQGTTISLTNPGTIGTVASTPRLMAGQSLIIATGAIEYPAEYQAMAPETLSQLGISNNLQGCGELKRIALNGDAVCTLSSIFPSVRVAPLPPAPRIVPSPGAPRTDVPPRASPSGHNTADVTLRSLDNKPKQSHYGLRWRI